MSITRRFVLALFCALPAPACDSPALDVHRQTITGGSPEPGYPSVFALAYNGEGGCTGTCIAARVGLTAAHCVEGGQRAS